MCSGRAGCSLKRKAFGAADYGHIGETRVPIEPCTFRSRLEVAGSLRSRSNLREKIPFQPLARQGPFVPLLSGRISLKSEIRHALM